MEREPTLFDQAVEALHQALAADTSAERTRLLTETLRLHRLVLAAVKRATRDGQPLPPALLPLTFAAARKDQGAV